MINDIDKNLDNILEIAENLPKVTKDTSPRVMPEINGMEEDTDFKYTRENLYNLLERGQDAVEELLEIAKQSEHPRAFEVVGQLIGKLTETNKELMGLHKTKKDYGRWVRKKQRYTFSWFCFWSMFVQRYNATIRLFKK